MPNAIKVSKSDKAIKAVLVACFPEWKGRKVRVQVATRYQMQNYWDGGSRCYVMAYSLATGKAAAPSTATTSPFQAAAAATVEIPDGTLLVEHQIFCGKDAGITIYVNPANMAPLLPAVAA